MHCARFENFSVAVFPGQTGTSNSLATGEALEDDTIDDRPLNTAAGAAGVPIHGIGLAGRGDAEAEEV